MDEEKKTVSVYRKLGQVKRTFRVIGEAATGPIMDFVAALRERELLAREVAAADARIQAIAGAAGLRAVRTCGFTEAIERFRATRMIA